MEKSKKQVGVVGASGYTGSELLRLLSDHPEVEVAFASAHSLAGRKVSEALPHLGSAFSNLDLISEESALAQSNQCDLLFLALPHGQSMSFISKLQNNVALVDLGNDFRLNSASEYQKWHGRTHSFAEDLPNWQYGLPELFRTQIAKSKKIANPGCYASAIILSLAPLIEEQLIETKIIASCVSGTSGAGKSLNESMHFSHESENVYAYKISSHQHTPEIEQTLSGISGSQVSLNFIPHVVPMVRGIHATVVANARKATDGDRAISCLKEYYTDEPFVSVIDSPPHTKHVRGSNNTLVHAHFDRRLGQITVTTVIDNLIKGAAGQAIQNMNVMFGYEESLGLPRLGIYP